MDRRVQDQYKGLNRTMRGRAPLKGPDPVPTWSLRLMISVCLMFWLGGVGLVAFGVYLVRVHDEVAYVAIGAGLLLIGCGVVLWVWMNKSILKYGGPGLHFAALWKHPPEEVPIFVDNGTWNWRFIRLFVGILAGIGVLVCAPILVGGIVTARSSGQPIDSAKIIIQVVGMPSMVALGFAISALIYRPYKLRLYSRGFTWGTFSTLFIGYDTLDPVSIRAVHHIERVKTMIDRKDWATQADTGSGNGIVFVCNFYVTWSSEGSQGITPTPEPMLWTITTHGDPRRVANAMIDIVTRFHDPDARPNHLTSVEDLTGDPKDAARQLPALKSFGEAG